MDTRSVNRSCRRSARLAHQPTNNKVTEQSTRGGHNSDTELSTSKYCKSDSASAVVSKMKGTQHTGSPKNMSPGTFEPTGTAKSSTNRGERIPHPQIFPHLPSINNPQQQADAALSSESWPEDHDSAEGSGQGGRLGSKWIKTDYGAMRLVDDATKRISHGAKSPKDKNHASGVQTIPGSQRGSARLDSTMLGVEGRATAVTDAHHSGVRPSPSGTRGLAAMEHTTESPIAGNSSPVATELRQTSRIGSPAESLDSNLTDINELPLDDSLSFANYLEEEASFAEMTSPIPELLADISRIIEASSPTAPRVSKDSSEPTDGLTASSGSSAMPTTAAPALASENPRLANRQIEIGDTLGHNPSLLRGVKHPADKISHEDQAANQNQRLPTSNTLVPVAAFPGPLKATEAATSLDGYQTDNDEHGGTSGGARLGGRTVETELTSGTQDKLEGVSTQTDVPTHTVLSPESGNSDLAHGARPSSFHHQQTQNSEHMAPAAPGIASQLCGLRQDLACGDCGKMREAVLVCVKCLDTSYCGKYCQIWNWPVHRQACKTSKEADPEEVNRMEEYLDDMWDGALELLEENVVVSAPGAHEDMEEQATLQTTARSEAMAHNSGEGATARELNPLLGGDGETVTDEDTGDDVGQHRQSLSGGRKRKFVDNIQNQEDKREEEEGDIFKMPPSSPESMFASRAKSLRLAQAADKSDK